jgi:hypothetical protein
MRTPARQVTVTGPAPALNRIRAAGRDLRAAGRIERLDFAQTRDQEVSVDVRL